MRGRDGGGQYPGGDGQQQAQQADPAPGQPRPGQPEAARLGVDLLLEGRHERVFPALEAVGERRGGHLARRARPQRDVRHHPPLERCQRPAGRFRRNYAHGRPRPAGLARPVRDRLTRTGRRVHLEPAACGQVDQGGPEAELVQPPGQQADDRGRLAGRVLRAAVGLLTPPAAWAAPSVRSRRRRDDQQDAEQEQPRHAGHDGHRKHGIPSDPSSHRSPGCRRLRRSSPAVPVTAPAGIWFSRDD
jgi:hypothetical protein